MTTSIDNREVARMVRRAADFLGGPGELARHLRVGRPHVMRLFSGHSRPNAVVLAELNRIITEYTAPEAYDLREKGTNDEYCTS
jgi:hypothetical protein